MTGDDAFRVLAVVAAFSLLTAQHWPWAIGKFFDGFAAATLWLGEHWLTLSRVVAAGLIVVAAWGVVPLPSRPVAPSVPVVVPTPSEEMQRLVEPVAAALGPLSPADRATWAATWAKAALVAEAEGGTSVEVLRDTPTLRAFTAVALDVAWRRIGGHAPGSVAGLREAVEAAMRNALGLAEVPVTPQMRSRYAEVARAIGWAGTR
jgi:hypothetical protein